MTSINEGISAARCGDVSRLQAWLTDGGNPNEYDAEGWTPLLIASVRGRDQAVDLLLKTPGEKADIDLPHRDSAALAIHLAGHSGSVPTAEVLLGFRPDHLNAVWDLNGHTILLQTVFYGHLDLATMLLKRGANTAITSARGLGAMEMATQYQNTAMMDLIRPFDSPPEAKAAYYKSYLARIAPVIPRDQAATQALSDELVSIIETGLKEAGKNPRAVETTLAKVKSLVEERGAEVNRLGGPLSQPPLIVTVTGNNGLPAIPDVARLRNELAKYLLEHGADPILHEKHPMGAQTIIRAAVFNHLDILKMCAKHISPEALADALNEIPVVNGLTALHDTVLRTTMAGPDRLESYLEQTRWCVANGARSDIEDFSGRTQRAIAEGAIDPQARTRILQALGVQQGLKEMARQI